MADCKLFNGDPRGKKCGICGERLHVGDIIYEWDDRLYEVGCLVRYATQHASPPPFYQPPGADWKAP
jgi:hypothetical protein